MTTLIEARDLTIKYGSAEVLRGVTLSVEPGEIVTIVGPNGSGKTTLLRALIGAERPYAGMVLRHESLRIGYVPQVLNIDRTMPITVAAFLSLGGSYDAARISAALDRVGVAHVAGQQIADLSGGQFQRVLLARAVLRDPELLVLDEPTKGLDQPGVAAFYQMLDTLRHEIGCGIIMVSHDLHVVMSDSDRVICINGHICCQGTPTVVSQAPEYRALFGQGTGGALALYKHHHDHSHDHDPLHKDDGPCGCAEQEGQAASGAQEQDKVGADTAVSTGP